MFARRSGYPTREADNVEYKNSDNVPDVFYHPIPLANSLCYEI